MRFALLPYYRRHLDWFLRWQKGFSYIQPDHFAADLFTKENLDLRNICTLYLTNLGPKKHLNKEYEIMEKFNTDVDASLILPVSFPEYVDPQLKDDMVSSFFFVNFFCDRVN